MDNIFDNEFNGFEWFDFRPTKRGRKNACLEEFYVTVSRHTPKGKCNTYRTAFSKSVSEIVKKKGLTHFRIRLDKTTGVMLIVFFVDSKDKCCRVTYERKNNTSTLVRLFNKQLCDFFADKAGIQGDFFPIYFKLSKDLVNRNDCAAFKIIEKL